MLSTRTLLGLILTATIAPGFVQEPEQEAATASPFPESWYGHWKGRCTNTSPKGGDRMNFAMELQVEALEDAGRTRWAIVYGEGERKQLRDYELIEVDREAGAYRIDEKNSIVLDAHLVGDVLHQLFRVNDRFLHVRFQREGDRMHVEMASFGEARETGNEVRSYALHTVQHGTLER